MQYSGVLVDSLTGQPIPGATVSMVTGADPVAIAQTATNGQFLFNNDTVNLQVVFTKIGYYPGQVLAADLAKLPQSVVALEPGSAETLEPVVVTPQLKWILGTAAIAFVGYQLLKK